MKTKEKPLVIGIGGGTGSGKTTIARAIMAELPPHAVSFVQHDWYYRDHPEMTPEQRAQVNFDHPDSLENELLSEHLDQLVSGNTAHCPKYDFIAHRRLEETQAVSSAPVILVEGILIFADPFLNERYDIRLFIDTPADIRVLRRARRDIEHRGRAFEDVRRQYYSTVRPMHQAFVEPAKYTADIIIPEGGNQRVAIDLVVERIRRELRTRSLDKA